MNRGREEEEREEEEEDKGESIHHSKVDLVRRSRDQKGMSENHFFP